ncbi:MAG: putative zinc-binding metallopeptidase [Pirellulales bacterium]|nr:putative zinc-binding metallopeptidase [Pirellulales bacterium]
MPEDELLKLRICDLGLQIEGTLLEERIARLIEDLEHRELRFRPHFWLAEEWFSPDGIPGIGIPFYLAHPRLMRLERKQMLEVEGGNEDWCLKILRHEVGHTFDTAYRLHRRKKYRELFGNYSQPYPNHYYPKPSSKNYVLHLEPAYAQAHPAEDFAETFAVWLKPRSAWRANYDGWPVIKKLEYLAELMKEIHDEKPAVVSREQVDSVRTIRTTLGEHYAAKRNRYRMNLPNLYDEHLRKLFSDSPDCADQPLASKYLRHIRGELRETVANWTGEHQYTIDQVLREIIDRCQQLKLRLSQPMSLTKRDALVLLTVQTMNFLHSGHHKVAL